MIYFITDSYNIKIGYSNKPYLRKKQLQIAQGNKLYLIDYIKGNKQKEKELHIKFTKYKTNVHNEWFTPSDKLINYINSISRTRYIVKEDKKLILLKKIKK